MILVALGGTLESMKPEGTYADGVGPHTWEDFIALPDDDRRELWNGWLVEAEVPTFLHEHIIAMLVMHIALWARTRGGRVVASGYRVKVDQRRGFFPDLQYYAPNRVPTRRSAGSEVPPDLAVEVIAPGSGGRDRLLKLQAYARRGISEYWIIDPDRTLLERLRLDEDGFYQLAEALEGDVPFAPASFPELTIDLAELWHCEEASAEA